MPPELLMFVYGLQQQKSVRVDFYLIQDGGCPWGNLDFHVPATFTIFVFREDRRILIELCPYTSLACGKMNFVPESSGFQGFDQGLFQ